MKIKIIFSFLSAAFFSLGVLFVSMDGRSGAVLGDTASVSPTVAQDIVTSLPAASVGTLPSSGTVAVMPVTPPSLQAVVSGPMSVELNWTRPGNASGTVTYKITRNGDVIKVYTNVLSHKDDGLSSGAEYKYSVWAKDELGRTVESPKVTVVLPVSSLKTDAAVTARTFPLPEVWVIVSVVVTATIGVLGLSAAVEGYFKHNMAAWQRIILAIGSLMLIVPEHITDLVGVVIVGLMVWLNYRNREA